MARFVGLVVVVGGLFAFRTGAESLTVSECEDFAPQPPYPAVNEPPNFQLWKDENVSMLPAAAACIGVAGPGFGTLVAVAATFTTSEQEADLVSRFGEVSGLRRVKYWSTTDRAWRPLILASTALTQEVRGETRGDFTASELEIGQSVYMSQKDSRSTREVIYRMRLRQKDADHFVIETENVTPVRWWALTLYKPGDLQTLYFIGRVRPGIWTFYSLSRMAGGSWLPSGHENSYINRVVALYRHFAGIPTDLEPPPAP